MIPTRGQKVWFDCRGGRQIPDGTYAAVVIAPYIGDGWWAVELEEEAIPFPRMAHQNHLRARDDPPPQQEPKRETTGNWDACVWKPSREVA